MNGRGLRQWTALAFDHPRPGDAFHDGFRFWVVVLHVTRDTVAVISGDYPEDFPEQGTLTMFYSWEEFRMMYRNYDNTSYRIFLDRRYLNVDGWYEIAKKVAAKR